MKLYNKFCKTDKSVRLIFSTSKIKDYFSTKDTVPECFKSRVVYEYRCARCNSCYVGRTHKHLTTRIREHLSSESSSIFKHLLENPQCKHSSPENDFKILDHASSQYELAVKEGLYINWLRPNLNKQKIHEVITLLCYSAWILGNNLAFFCFIFLTCVSWGFSDG